MLQQLRHRRVRILRLTLLRRLIAFPLDEAAADRVVLLLEQHLVARHELARHGVGMRELALRRVIDHVFQRRVERLGAQLHLEDLVGIGGQAVEECGLHGRGLLADNAGKRGTLGAVTLAGCAEAAEQVDLKGCCLRELIGGKLRCALVEVVGDAHRADRVRARWTGADLVELVDRRHHRPLGLLDDIELC